MYFARKRLWKSLRIVSLTKVLPFFSGAPRAWWRKTTSSFQRLLTAPPPASRIEFFEMLQRRDGLAIGRALGPAAKTADEACVR